MRRELVASCATSSPKRTLDIKYITHYQGIILGPDETG